MTIRRPYRSNLRPAFLAFLFSVSSLALAQGNPELQSSLSTLRALENVKKDLHERIADGIVTVQLVRRDLPTGLLSALERCTSEAQIVSWRRGEINEAERDQWRQWCNSFLSQAERELLALHAERASDDPAGWDSFLGRSFQTWIARAEVEYGSKDESFRKFRERLNARLVRLSGTLERMRMPRGQPVILRQSTGFLVDKGIVVTTRDVARIQNPNEWVRVYSGKQIAYSTGEVLGCDNETSIAVIRLASPGSSLESTIPFPEAQNTSIGTFVFSFYHAFNQLSLSMRTGEVTGTDRELPFFHGATFLETSIPTSPGTLGAPLVDSEGQLVGMGNLFMCQGTMSEITYALPADQLRSVVNQILRNGRVERGCIGVYLKEVPCLDGSQKHVLVTGVVPGSAASEGGVQPGDIITALDGNSVHCRTSLLSALSRYKVNDRVTLMIQRKNQPMSLQLCLVPLPDSSDQ